MIDYNKYIGKNAGAIPPSGIRKFFDIVAVMKDAISLGVGEPDFDTPWSVRNSAINCIKRGDTQYTSNTGMLQLREAISKYLKIRYNLTYDANTEILVTVGASEGIDLALRMLINEGDEILIPEPSYVSYQPCVTLCNGVAKPVACFIKDEFRVTAENLEKAITPNTKALILPYPNNPTGSIMERKHLEEIAQVVSKHDLIVISDEIYSELTYGVKHVSFADIEGMRERTIVLNGFSKAFAMTGWRLGYVAAPKPFLDIMLKIHQYAIMCASTVSQYAGLKAMEDGFLDNFSTIEEMHEQYDMRRRFIVKKLNEIGLTCFEPKGAFYVFPDVSTVGMTGEQFATELLKAKKVAVVPGIAFGESGNNFVRISYAYSIKKLQIAMERIEEFVKEIKSK